MRKSFYPMDRVEALTLALLVAFSALSFLPAFRTHLVLGMAVFGWLMATLMILSPAAALLVLRRSQKR